MSSSSSDRESLDIDASSLAPVSAQTFNTYVNVRTHLLPMSMDNMVTSLVLCRRCSVRRDGVSGSNDSMSAENDNSGD